MCALALLAPLQANAIIIIIGGPPTPPPVAVHSTGPTAVGIAPGLLLPNGTDRLGRIHSRAPSINATGQVVFHGELQPAGAAAPTTNALFLWDGGQVQTLLREGDPGPGGVGTISRFGGDPLLNDAGTAAVQVSLGSLPASATGDQAWLVHDGARATWVAQEGGPIPDGPGSFVLPAHVVLSQNGTLAFTSGLTGTAAPPSDANGIYRFDGSGLAPIVRGAGFGPISIDASGRVILNGVRYGAGAPEVLFPSGVLQTPGIARLTVSGAPVFDTQGRAAFRGAAYDAASSFLGSGVFLHDADNISTLVMRGDPLPPRTGFAPSTFGGATTGPLLSETGTVSFIGRVDEDLGGFQIRRRVFFQVRDGQLQDVVRESQLLDTGERPTSLGEIASSPSGLVAITGQTRDRAGVFRGLLLITDGTDVVTLASPVRSVPGLSPNGIRLRSGQNPGGQGAVNDRGQVAFEAGSNLFVVTPDLHWRATSSGSWDDANQWTLGIDPASVHAVALDAATDLVVSGSGADTQVASLAVGGGAGKVQLRLDSGAELASASWIDIKSTGRIVQDQGTLRAASLDIAGAYQQNAGDAFVGVLVNGGTTSLGGRVETQGRIEQLGDLHVLSPGTLTGTDLLQWSGVTTVDGRLDLTGGTATVRQGVLGGSGDVVGSVVMGGGLLEGSGLQITGGLDIESAASLELRLDLGTTGLVADALQVGLLASLEGTLRVDTSGGAGPGSVGDFFDVLIAGQIDASSLLGVSHSLAPGLDFSVAVVPGPAGGQALRLTLVPEPGSVLLVLGGLSLAVVRSRSALR